MIRASQTPIEPSPHRWFPWLLGTRVDSSNCRIMVNCLGMDRFHQGNIVGNTGNIRNDLAKPGPILSMFGKFKHGATQEGVLFSVIPVIL